MHLIYNLKMPLSCIAIALLLKACGGGSTPKQIAVIEPTPL
jgi:hypothetical protein